MPRSRKSSTTLRTTAVSAVLFGAIALWGLHGSPAKAGDYTMTFETADYGEKDGDWVEYWRDSDGGEWIFVIQNYRCISAIAPWNDPGPDDDKDGQTDIKSIIAILKQHGGPLVMNSAFARSPLGKLLIREGKGIIPVYNPSDSGFEDGGTGSGGFDPGAGSPEAQLKKRAKHGSGDGGKGDDGSDLKPGEVGLFDDDSPVSPEKLSRSWTL